MMTSSRLMASLKPSKEAPSPFIRALWNRLQHLPGGKYAFSRIIGRVAPYTGTIRPSVRALRHGHARVLMPYRRGVLNHIACIHAAALFNLVEFTALITLAYTVPDDARFIVAGMSMEYLKKARGDVTGVCECPDIASSQRREYEIPVTLYNEAQEVIARGTIRALIGPRRG